jgi:hypothetical protein
MASRSDGCRTGSHLEADMIKAIPLSKLTPSPRNVRRSTDEQADLQLKANIEARGLLQNLVVAPASKPRGSFAVEAGGRRLRALKTLVEEGKLDAAHEVPCLVIGGGAVAQEASLAENFHRLAMNPADECLAFGQLIEQGADVEGVARRFGLTIRFVEGRLRLAALAPAGSAAAHAAALTAVSTGRRSFLGGVRITGEVSQPVITALPYSGLTLGEACASVGSSSFEGLPRFTIFIGGGDVGNESPAVTAFWDGWTAGVRTAGKRGGPTLDATNPLAGVAAGALAVGVAFDHQRGRSGNLPADIQLWDAGQEAPGLR